MLVVVLVNFFMSINVTVNANPISVKRGKMLLTDVNELKKQEINRRRKMRIEQVRQQSKDIANHIRKRVQQKKGSVLKAAEMKENLELQNHQDRKLKSLQQKYHECLDEVGLAHTHAALQPDPVAVLAAEMERISDQAKIRGKQAIEKQKAENRKAFESGNLLKAQKKFLRAAEDLRAAKIVAGDDRPERIPLMSTAVNVQRDLPSNTVRHQPTDVGTREVQQTSRVTEQRPKDLGHFDGDASDNSISAPCSDEDVLVPCYDFQPSKPSKYSRRSDIVDNAAGFGEVLEVSYPDWRTTEQTSGRKKSPKFVELPEVLDDDDDDDDRKSPDSQERASDQYYTYSDVSSTSHNPASTLSAYGKRPGRDQQAPSSKTSGPQPDPSRILTSEQKSVLRPMTSGPKSDPSRISGAEQKSALRPMISEQLTSSEADSHYTVPRTVPVWQPKESRRSAASVPSSRQVHFYDHSSRYQQQCYHPKDVVQKIDEPFQKTAVQLAEEATAASEALQKRELERKQHLEQLQQSRSSQALARERLKRQYSLLLSELEALSRKERIARAQNISATAPAIHMSESRWKERGNIRQKNMDSVFERVYYSSSGARAEDDAKAVSGSQEKISEPPCDKQKNVTVESEVKLNVGCCVPPQTAAQGRFPVRGKERVSPEATHGAAETELNGQQISRAPVPSKKLEKAPHLADPAEVVNTQPEKTSPLFSEPSGVGRAVSESVDTVSEARSVSACSSSQMSSSSSSSDAPSKREMSTNTDSKVLNSKHKIDVLKSESTRQTAGNNTLPNRMTLLECSDTVSMTGVFRAERRQETLKGSLEKESQKEGLSKHCKQSYGEDPKEQQNCERLKLLRSKATESKKMKDNSDKVRWTAASSSSSSVSDRSVLESRETCFADPEISTDRHSPYDNVKIVVKVRDKLQEVNGSKPNDTVDSQGANRKTKEGKHCKQHCGKKMLYRDIFTKESQRQSGASDSLHLDSGQTGLDRPGRKSPETLKSKPYRYDEVRRDKLHGENGATTDSDDDEEKREVPSKQLDETMNATSASTSYFSPPEKMSTARAKEIESAVDAISSYEQNTHRSDPTVADTQVNVNPQLSCYIRRLLAMSRESVENLNVSVSDISIQAEEIFNSSAEQPFNNIECRRAWLSILSDRSADNRESLQHRILELNRGSEPAIDSCAEDVKKSNRTKSSDVCDSKCNAWHLTASELTDVHIKDNRDCDTVDLPGTLENVVGAAASVCEEVTQSGDGTIVEVNHNDLLTAMNERIISAINEMDGTVASLPVESSVVELERPVPDITSTQADLNELAEKYSKRVSDLSKKLEHLRLEKRHILEMSSSGSDREVCDTTAYSSPPLSIVPDVKQPVISLHRPDNVQPQAAPPGSDVPTSLQEHNGINHSLRGKPPVSLSQKLIRDICTPHELSTIIEVDSPRTPLTQTDNATEFVTRFTRDNMINSDSQTSVSEVSATRDKNNSALEGGSRSAKDKNLSDYGGDTVRDIMAELLQRKLLTSPYHWLKDEFKESVVEQESSVTEAAVSNECSDGEKLDSKTSKENGNNAHCVTNTSEETSFQTTTKSENSNVEEKGSLAHNNLHQMDLHNVFEKLGIGWANSMLRKTRKAMTYSSSSSENSHDFSASRRKNSVKDSKSPKHQALNYETGKPHMNRDLLQYEKEHFAPTTLGSDVVPLQVSTSPDNSIKSNVSKTRETETSTARDESCDDEHLGIKVPNICLTTKLKVSISGSSSLS